MTAHLRDRAGRGGGTGYAWAARASLHLLWCPPSATVVAASLRPATAQASANTTQRGDLAGTRGRAFEVLCGSPAVERLWLRPLGTTLRGVSRRKQRAYCEPVDGQCARACNVAPCACAVFSCCACVCVCMLLLPLCVSLLLSRCACCLAAFRLYAALVCRVP